MLHDMDAEGTPVRDRRARPVLALGVLAALAVLVITAGVAVSALGLGPSGGKAAPPGTSPVQAMAIARAFYVAGHPADATLTEVVVGNPAAAATKSGRASWRVQVGGAVTEKGSGITYYSVMWLLIDVETGAVTIEAQG